MTKPLHLSLLRRPALALLKACNRDITIKHHWVGHPLKLNLFQHKGYWYHGRNREKECIEFCQKLLTPTDIVAEVGGHIGYLSQVFASIAKQVFVFEPGTNNLRYLRDNIAPFKNVRLIEKAVSSENGRATFYLDPLTGQNNSLLQDYSVFAENRALADARARTTATEVEVVRLDDAAREFAFKPTFVKIDVEGAELNVLQGMTSILQEARPKLMLEISENLQEVENLLRCHGYSLFKDDGQPASKITKLDNIFALPA